MCNLTYRQRVVREQYQRLFEQEPKIPAAAPSCNKGVTKLRSLLMAEPTYETFCDAATGRCGAAKAMVFRSPLAKADDFSDVLGRICTFIKTHVCAGLTEDQKSTLKAEESYRILRFLYTATLFRQSRHASAFSSEALTPYLSTTTVYRARDFIDRLKLAERLLEQLHGTLGVFYYKDGGYCWADRDIRIATRVLLDHINLQELPAVKNKLVPLQLNGFWASRAQGHYHIGQWYVTAFFATGDPHTCREALYHFFQSIRFSPFGQLEINRPDNAEEGIDTSVRMHFLMRALLAMGKLLRISDTAFAYWEQQLDPFDMFRAENVNHVLAQVDEACKLTTKSKIFKQQVERAKDDVRRACTNLRLRILAAAADPRQIASSCDYARPENNDQTTPVYDDNTEKRELSLELEGDNGTLGTAGWYEHAGERASILQAAENRGSRGKGGDKASDKDPLCKQKCAVLDALKNTIKDVTEKTYTNSAKGASRDGSAASDATYVPTEMWWEDAPTAECMCRFYVSTLEDAKRELDIAHGLLKGNSRWTHWWLRWITLRMRLYAMIDPHFTEVDGPVEQPEAGHTLRSDLRTIRHHVYTKITGAKLPLRGVPQLLRWLKELMFVEVRAAKLSYHARKSQRSQAHWASIVPLRDFARAIGRRAAISDLDTQLDCDVACKQLLALALANLGRFVEAHQQLNGSAAILRRRSQASAEGEAVLALRRAEVYLTHAHFAMLAHINWRASLTAGSGNSQVTANQARVTRLLDGETSLLNEETKEIWGRLLRNSSILQERREHIAALDSAFQQGRNTAHADPFHQVRLVDYYTRAKESVYRQLFPGQLVDELRREIRESVNSYFCSIAIPDKGLLREYYKIVKTREGFADSHAASARDEARNPVDNSSK